MFPKSVLEDPLIRYRLAVMALAALAALAFASPRTAHAAPEIHNFSLVISGMPTSINTGGFNKAIDQYNRIRLNPRNLNSLEEINFGWMFDAELRYLVRPNVAVSVGVGQLKTQHKREYLPLINQSINVRAEVLTVPVHAGADYYFSPYTQGDFQARGYVGGGVLSSVYTKATFQQSETNTTPTTTLGGSFVAVGRRDAPGFYAQTGVHMFFASRYSAMIGVLYRNSKAEELIDPETGQPARDLLGNTIDLDVGGVGARMSVAIGF